MSQSVAVGVLRPPNRSVFALSSDSRRGDMVDQASEGAALDVPTILANISRGDEIQATDFEVRQREGVSHLCKKCGNKIPEVRRKAKPKAVRCTPCEDAHEQLMKSKRR